VRTYELGVIFHPEMMPEAIQAYGERIAQHGGEVIARQTWGRRRLAYPIKHKRDGHYLFWHFRAESPTLVNELETMFRVSEEVLRYLVVRAEHLPALTPDKEAEPATAEG